MNNQQDNKAFATLMFGLGEVYDKEITNGKLEIYQMALSGYTIEQIKNGATKHIRDADSGMFMPKPADIIRQIEGTIKMRLEDDKAQAQFQWMNVINAIKRVGSYRTPKLDDPYTRASITALGGWTCLCGKTEKELEWVGKDFITTYMNMNVRPLEQLPDSVKGLEDMQEAKKSESSTLKSVIKQLERNIK